MSNYYENGFSTSNRHCILDSDQFLANMFGATATYSFQCTLQSMDADGFTLAYSNTTASAEKVIFLALGGISAKILPFTLNTTTGVQAVTGVGFQPGSVLVMSTGQAAFDTASANGDGAKFMIGVASDTDEQFSFGTTAEDNQADTDEDHYQHTLHLGRIGDFNQGTEEEFALSSFESDGFNINVETALGASPSVGVALALEAGFDSGGGNSGSGSGGTASKDASFMFGWINT